MRIESEREKRSIRINTKSAKNLRPKNNAKQMISHLYFPSLFFAPFLKRRRQKFRRRTSWKHTTLLFDFSPILLVLHVERYAHNKLFYVFHILFWCLYPQSIDICLMIVSQCCFNLEVYVCWANNMFDFFCTWTLTKVLWWH